MTINASIKPYVQILVDRALTEYHAFHEISESDEPLRSRIDEYCRAIDIAPPRNVSDFAWSAVFISWCVKTAGATNSEFKFDASHSVFVKAAIANADAERGVFRARPIDVYAPKLGDIIQRNRSGGTITYKQARTRTSYPSHSAIVVEIGQDDRGRFAITVGGNEGDSIRRARVELTNDGKVVQKSANPFICVIENRKVEGSSLAAAPESAQTHGNKRKAKSGPVCDAAGELELAIVESASDKPKVDRLETTSNKSSRNGAKIDHLVMHYTTSRDINGTISHFKNPNSEVSAHYIIGQDGELVQMVADEDRAWHAGKSTMNARSIGIEHVAAEGDRIKPAQATTSLALIRWLMSRFEIPLAHIIPHACVKPTSCCGDLFKDYGGGAGLSCDRQKNAVHKWLAENGVTGTEASTLPEAVSRAPATAAFESGTEDLRLVMAQIIVNFEARRDSNGHLTVYRLPETDGGGGYEVAGINERFHKELCDELVALIEDGRQAEAERRAVLFIASYTDTAGRWTRNPGIEFYLRDSIFNRGTAGAAWILQKALSVETDGHVGSITMNALKQAEADPKALLGQLRKARENYERRRRDESHSLWKGLVNRWNKAKAKAAEFMSGQLHEVWNEANAHKRTDDETIVPPQYGQPHAFEDIPFLVPEPSDRPCQDIGDNSPIDDPEHMLRGIRAMRNGVPADVEVNLELVIGQDSSLPAAFLELLAKRRLAVGKINASGVDFRGQTGSWSGTGFLVGKNILLTNHHVLNSHNVAAAAKVDFQFEVTADLLTISQEPARSGPRQYRLDPTRLFITSPLAPTGLDFTFVWIEDEAETTFGSIPLRRSFFSVEPGEQAFIIHHPRGRGKRVSLDDTEVLHLDSNVILYSTDTEPGSSGAPVFNRQGQLIGLHHASKSFDAQLADGGRTNLLNEGIKIAAIISDLERRPAAERAAVEKVLQIVDGSDSMSGFFGVTGRTEVVSRNTNAPEGVIETYQATDVDFDVGYSSAEMLEKCYRDREYLRKAAFFLIDIGQDVWCLADTSQAAVDALVEEVDRQFGQKFDFAVSDSQRERSTIVLWKTKTVDGKQEEWPPELEQLWHINSGSRPIFSQFPGLFKFAAKGCCKPFAFYMLSVEMAASMRDEKLRRLGSRVIARVINETAVSSETKLDCLVAGRFDGRQAARDLDELLSDNFRIAAAASELTETIGYLRSQNSPIDRIYLSPNLVQHAGDAAFTVTAKEKPVDKFVGKLSEKWPALIRLCLSDANGESANSDLDREITRLLSKQK